MLVLRDLDEYPSALLLRAEDGHESLPLLLLHGLCTKSSDSSRVGIQPSGFPFLSHRGGAGAHLLHHVRSPVFP